MTNGNDSKRSTSHGKLKDFSNAGGYTGSLNYYFDANDRKWPTFSDLIKKDDFTADDIDKAFNTGDYYPTESESNAGKFTYNADLDAKGKNHYGEALYKQIVSTRKRLIQSL